MNSELIQILAIRADHLIRQRDFSLAQKCLSFIHTLAQGIEISDEMLKLVGIQKKEATQS